MNNQLTGQKEADKYLVQRVLNGDNTAFATIIQQTEPLVAQICSKMIPDTTERKDLAQETYLKVYRSLGGFRFQAKLSTWVAQVAYNTCLDHLRRKRAILPGDLEDQFASRADTGRDALAEIRNRELSVILREGIATLPPIYQTLITLYHQEEMSYDEIREITGLPEGTIKSYLFRARKALKDKLSPHYSKEDI